MRRRDLLAAVAGGTGIAVAGCTASGREIGDLGSDETHLGSDEAHLGSDEAQPASERDDQYDVGSPDEADGGDAVPHRVIVENAGDERREVGVRISIDGESAFDDSRELAAADRLVFRLLEPTGYRLSIEADGSRSDLRLEGASTDCTESETTITLRDDGISTEMESTSGDCRSEGTTTGYEFESGDGECAGAGETDRASVAFEEDVVRVEGVVETPTPCHRLSLADLETDAEGCLEIVVAVDEPAVDLCVECLGTVPYTAAIDRPDDPPKSVAVVYERGGERRTVESVERDG